MLKNLTLTLKGILIGIANIIPGLSGATIAVLLNIYKDLTGNIGDFIPGFLTRDGKTKSRISFLFFILLGAGIGIVLFSFLFGYILESAYAYIFYAILAGFILGSFPYLFRSNELKVNPSFISFFLLGILILYVTVHLIPHTSTSSANVDMIKYEIFIFKFTNMSLFRFFWLIFIGFCAAAAMILPGFSGSALLVALGEYENILNYIRGFLVSPLLCIGFGAFVGLIVMSKVIEWLLFYFPKQTFAFILGLIIYSLFEILVLMISLATGVESYGVMVFLVIIGTFFTYKLSKFEA